MTNCKDFEESFPESISTNPKGFWKYVNSKLKTRIGVGDLIQTEGKVTEDEREKGNAPNDYFSRVFTEENSVNVPKLERRHIGPALVDVTITEEEVRKKLLNQNGSKSSGPGC